MSEHGSFDYIVVGAGSAGCALAGRLSEDADTRVLLVEAGGWDRSAWIHIPLGWGRILKGRRFDWGYDTEPEERLDGRQVECARGKVVGGSSAINAMAYVRGNRIDYDRWAASGLTGWSYEKVLPYFRRQEDWQGPASEFRGRGGPLTVRPSAYRDPIVEACFEAGRAQGIPLASDYNGAEQEGFARTQETIRDGRRCSAAVAYLRPALDRRNLTVVTETLVRRIVVESGRAVGIEVADGGDGRTIRAEREVLVAAGTINSPQLLMLSGIGDPEALSMHGLPVEAPLRGVGRNLQDHISVGVDYARKGKSSFLREMRADRIARSIAQAYALGTGFAAEMPSGWMGFVRAGRAATVPDVQLLFRAGSTEAWPYLPPFVAPFPDTFGCRAVVLRPESRGRVTLRSADPAAPPLIRQNFLASERDWATCRDGLRLVRELASTPALRPFVDRELEPGPGRTSDSELDAHIRRFAATAHHPAGTCRMGLPSDPDAVVDDELRVFGVEGLRVVDASVMPDLVGGNINAPVVMIAERAADLIRGAGRA